MAFMTHPNHGATHVSSAEIESHTKNGWKIDTYENWLSSKKNDEKEAIDAPVIRNKPGRKARAQ